MGFFLEKKVPMYILRIYYAVHLDLYDAEPPESWKNLKRHDVSVPNEIGQKGQVLRIKGFFFKVGPFVENLRTE